MSGTVVHVVPGDFPSMALRDALGLSTAQVLVDRDRLSLGPLIRTRSLEAWRRSREAHLRSVFLEWPDLTLAGEVDVLANVDRLRSVDRVRLWLGTTVDEQLLRVWMVQLFGLIGGDPGRLEVVQFPLRASGSRHRSGSSGRRTSARIRIRWSPRTPRSGSSIEPGSSSPRRTRAISSPRWTVPVCAGGPSGRC